MLRRFALLILLGLVPSGAVADAALDEHEIEFLHLINEYRAANGLGCLAPSLTMNDAADYMSQAMGELNFFAHEEPPCNAAGECTGRDPFDRITDFGHDRWNTAGENIAAGYPTAAEVFEGWRNSPGHNANMLHDGFTAIGIGRVVVPGSKFRVYWTTDFSNWIDGPWGCEGPVDDGETEGSGGSGGDGGAGGSGGATGDGGTGGAGGDGGDGGSSDSSGGSSSSCSAGGSEASLLGLLGSLALVGRRIRFGRA